MPLVGIAYLSVVVSLLALNLQTLVPQPQNFNVKPDEEWLVVGLELDLEQGGVHPQGENVLR